MHRYRILLLGAHGVSSADGSRVDFPSGKPFALLAHLLLQPEACGREGLGRLLWPATSREKQLQSVRQALWLIRRTLGEDVVMGDDPVRIDLEVVTSDVAQLSDAIVTANADQVEALYSGPLLSQLAIPGVPEFDEWLDEQRSRLERIVGAALATAGVEAADQGDVALAVRRLKRASSIEPYRLQHRLALFDTLLANSRAADAEQTLLAAQEAFPEAEFARELDLRRAQLRDVRRRTADDPGRTLSHPEFVGRGRELARLAGSWTAARRGRTQRVVLRGEAGVGKTRLTEELGQIAARDGGRFIVVRTAAAEHEMQWAAVATLVRRLLLLPGAGGVSAASELVLHRLVPSLARHAHAEGVAHLPDAAPLADAVADLIGAVAYETPLLIVLDDVQWLDAASWTLLSRLMVQLDAEPVLFLLALRSGEIGLAPEHALRRVQDMENSTTLHVENFTAGEVTEFLSYNAGVDDVVSSATLVTRLHQLTRGNPFFLVETLKAFRDNGVLTWSSGRWALREDVLSAQIPLPRSMQELITHRLRELSPAATTVALVLAERRASVAYSDLRERSQLQEAELAAAIAELIQRGVCTPCDVGYVLVHDQIAAALRELASTSDPRWFGMRRRTVMITAAIVLLLASVGLVSLLQPNQPLYGGGAVYVIAGDTLLEMRPPTRRNGEWRVEARPGAVPLSRTSVQAPFRTINENFVWFANIDTIPSLSPFPVEILPDVSVREYERHDRYDVGMGSLSPDGRRVAYLRDDPNTPEYDRQIRMADRTAQTIQTIGEDLYIWGPPLFSPDGMLLAVTTSGRTDSLLVLTARGDIRHAYSWDNVGSYAWCRNDLLVVVAETTEGYRLFRVPLGQPAEALTPEIIRSSIVACAPDSSAVLAHTIVHGVVQAAVIDLQSGIVVPVVSRRQLDVGMNVRWLSDRIAAVPQQLELRTPRDRFRIGDEVPVSAEIVYSDGTRRSVNVELTTEVAGTASVLPGGRLVGNRAGAAVIRGTYGGWLTDSLAVVVTGDRDVAMLFQETFETLDSTRWQPFGDPIPAITTVGGERLLHLRGDGNYGDGVALREPFTSDQGLTVELEFRLSLTEPKWQRLVVSFCGARAPLTKADFDALDSGHQWDRQVTFYYPEHELAKFDPANAGLTFVNETQRVPLAGTLPSTNWTHVALQIRPDGYASMAVNHERVATSKIRDPGHRDFHWYMCLSGASVGTELYVRNLRVWRGVRY